MCSSLRSASELELLGAVIRGEQGAWNEFYRRYERLIVACIRKVLQRYGVPCLSADVEDLINNACLELIRNDYKKLRAYDPDRGYKLSSWVGLIATNVAHDALRRRGPAMTSIDDEQGWVETRDDEPSPAQRALLREREALLNEATERLSPAERRFMYYYYGEGLEPAEIAEMLGISINTVYSRKNKVRASLRRIIEQIAQGEP